MRPILLMLFGGLIFLLALVLAQGAFALDSPQMRLLFTPLWGREADQRYALGVTARDCLAYLFAAIATIALLYWAGRLMYSRDGSIREQAGG